MAYLAVSNLAFVAVVVLLVRELRYQSTVIESVARSGSPDLTTMTELVADLCQRIQAPAVAVAEHAGRQFPTDIPMHVPMDNDEEYWESKEELAERLAGLNGPT